MELEALSITPDWTFAGYIALGMPDGIPPPSRQATLHLASWTDPAADREVPIPVCSVAGSAVAALGPDADHVAVTGQGEGCLFDLAGDEPPVVLWRGVVNPEAADGSGPVEVVTSPRSGDDDGAQRDAPPEDGSCDGPTEPWIASLAWSPDGTRLALSGYESAAEDGSWAVYVLNEIGGDLERTWIAPARTAWLEIPGWEDEQTLILRRDEADWQCSPGRHDVLQRWRVQSTEPPEELPFIDLSSSVMIVAGRIYEVAGDGTVRDVVDGNVAARLDLPPWPYPGEPGARYITRLAGLPGGQIAVTVADLLLVGIMAEPCCVRLVLFSGVSLR
jgi:hypothetical protein